MEITEVRIKLMDEPGERLQAFCSITFDDAFVIRDLKIIDGPNGPFVAMPSRKLTARCGKCGCKNPLRAAYCNQCGARLREPQVLRDGDGRAKLYADIAHPINSRCREALQQRIVQAYHAEVERSQLPGYVSSYDDFEQELEAEAFSESDTRHEAHETARPHFRPPQGKPNRASGPQQSGRAQGPHQPSPQRPAEQRPAGHAHQQEGQFGEGIL